MPERATTGVCEKDGQEHLVRPGIEFWEGGSSAARAGLQNSRGLVVKPWGSLVSSLGSKRLIPSSGRSLLLAARTSRRAKVLSRCRRDDDAGHYAGKHLYDHPVGVAEVYATSLPTHKPAIQKRRIWRMSRCGVDTSRW